MTTPKRYEEMAEDLAKGAVRLSDSLSTPYVDKRRIANALRTAAREAQVRVLEAAQDLLIFDEKAFRTLVTLKERIENGEDL